MLQIFSFPSLDLVLFFFCALSLPVPSCYTSIAAEMHASIGLIAMAAAAMAFTSPIPKETTTYPPTEPDCFGDNGVITPCPTVTGTSTTTKLAPTILPIMDCFDYQGIIVPCPTDVVAKCWNERGFQTSCHRPRTTPSACTSETTALISPTVITFGTTTITVGNNRTFTPTSNPLTATFCLSPEGHSSQCAVGTGATTTSTCSGSYFNGACECPCGAACSCPASTMTTTKVPSPITTSSATTSTCSGSYFNGACQCPCGAVCSCPAPTTTTTEIPAPITTSSTTTSTCSGSYFNGACQCPCGAACSCPASTMTTSVQPKFTSAVY